MTRILSILQNWFISPMRMNSSERRANIDGLNILFGAVLGFVLAGTETMGTYDFALTLFYSAALVVTILYVTHSRYRLAYALIAIVGVATLREALNHIFTTPTAQIPLKLQPTFAVWLVMTLTMEFWPRVIGTKPVDPADTVE